MGRKRKTSECKASGVSADCLCDACKNKRPVYLCEGPLPPPSVSPSAEVASSSEVRAREGALPSPTTLPASPSPTSIVPRQSLCDGCGRLLYTAVCVRCMMADLQSTAPTLQPTTPAQPFTCPATPLRSTLPTTSSGRSIKPREVLEYSPTHVQTLFCMRMPVMWS